MDRSYHRRNRSRSRSKDHARDKHRRVRSRSRSDSRDRSRDEDRYHEETSSSGRYNNQHVSRHQGQTPLLPLEGTIYKGKIVKIESFGAFVALQGYRQQGLVHISQLVRDRVESANEVVTIDQEVYVKVLAIDTTDSSRPKISLSMKYADQGSGADKDPNGVEAELSMRKKTTRKGEPEPLKLEAVLNTVCKRCGGRGHISSECFNTGGVKYELVEAEPEESSLQPEVAVPALAPAASAPVGRGRGAVLPSWLTNTNSTSDTHLGGVVGGSTSGATQKKEERKKHDKKTKKEKKSKKSKKGVEKKKSKDKKHKRDKKHKEKHKGSSKKVSKTHEIAVALAVPAAPTIRSASLSSSSSSSSSSSFSSRSRSNSTRS